MPPLTAHAFTFASQALPANTFTVVRFSGEEALSSLYRFEILLVAKMEEAIDLTAVLQNPATFTIKKQTASGSDLPFHGILSAFEELHQAGDYVFYRAELRPRLWWLTLTNYNQVFLGKKVNEFLTAVLQDGGLAEKTDFEFRFQGVYSPWEYLCQYAESHFNFVSRWLEREGACYWFEQNEDGEKLIVSDTLIAHTALPGYETFLYSPPSGLDAVAADRVIKRFTLRQSPLPQNVLLKDYDYLKPSLDLQGKASVQGQGRGEIYLYGEHFLDQAEADRLAKARAEEFLCREKVFHGLSAIPGMRPGYLFTLEKHFRAEFNQQYLTMAVRHEGSQERSLSSGLGIRDLEDQDGLFYRNTFECIPATAQFRPARVTPKPRITGTLSAKIDAAGSDQYAELDEQGRYKVILPFDLSAHQEGGKASAYVRMSQPYAGQNHGIHFPLHKGTEVLLSFSEGDPDRPVIAGAVPNPETPSVVNDKSATQCDITTSGGNKINFEDKKDHERILIFCPHEDSLLKLGYPLEDREWYKRAGFDGLATIGAIIDLKGTLIKLGFDLAGVVLGDHAMGVDDGIEMRTTNGLKIAARKKEQAIGGYTSPGYSTTNVVGIAQLSVKGYSAKSVLGYCDESTKGIHSFNVVGTYNESIMGWKAYFAGKKDSLVATATKAKGYATKVYGGLTKVAESVSHAAVSVVEMFGSKAKVAEEDIEMMEIQTSMAGEDTELNGERTEMSGEKTEMNGEQTSMTGESTRICGESTEVGGESMRSFMEMTSMAGEEVELRGESIELLELKVIV